MLRNLPNIFGRIFNTPLALPPARLDPLLAGLHAATLQRGSLRLRALDDEWDDRPRMQRGYSVTAAGVAALPVRGILLRREGEIDADSTEFESYARLGANLDMALNDRSVRAILLDIDSLGGEVSGLFDLAADIRTAATIKPVWAMANDDAMSAAYALASAASRVWISDTGGAGSIGVVAVHRDQSGFDEAHGLAYSYVYAGAHKVDGNPHEPLGDGPRAIIQAEVDRVYGMFVNLVARNRPISAAAARATEAAIFYGSDAVAAGLADQLGTLPQAISALGDLVSSRSRTMDTTQLNPPAPALEAKPAALPTAEEIAQAVQQAAEGAQIVRLDAVREAINTVSREHEEIASLCTLAGFPDLIAGFIANKTPQGAVRAELQRRRAEADQARQVQTVDPTPRQGTGGEASDMNKVLAARWASQMGRN